ncbi:MAG: hypothetical protein V7723_00535 [Sneathiella sp.]|uniref:hypothetical protein n=1 Tax=Sneathiella sp. TaxID=1964365 RepID=UPI003001D6CA
MDDQRYKPKIKTGGPGPFTTWVVQKHPMSGFLHQTSRRRRKTIMPPVFHTQRHAPHELIKMINHHWFQIWATSHLSWWIAVLFMVGAAHFALASALSLWPDLADTNLGLNRWIGDIYFLGSLFFTSAAYLQWIQAVNSPLTTEGLAAQYSQRSKIKYWGWRSRDLGYLSSAVQLIGTIFFNFNTGDALVGSMDMKDYDVVVWLPNFLGSICFLLASQFAVMEFSHAAFSFKPKQISWWIVAINMTGAILFMLSAIVSFMSSGNLLNIPWLANTGTFGGAICFLVAAYLLIPEFFEKTERPN